VALRDKAGTPWRIHAVLPRSLANGPGPRYVIWSQGCTLGCPGCFNPQTHPPTGPAHPPTGLARPLTGTVAARPAEEVADAVLAEAEAAGIEGVTLTGGEPLQQPEPVSVFCDRIRARSDLGIIVLTGFTRREIERDPARAGAVTSADLVIAGRYNARRHLGRGLRGSDNKAYWPLTSRYRAEQFTEVPEVELILAPDGTLTVTGLPAGAA
jgi:anaerobic ribonucleoside-triphosphate reductase activating protein